jgi:putative hemolysin
MLPVDEFKEAFSIPRLQGEEKGYFRTVGGFVMMQLGRVPKASDHFHWNGFRFEVVDMDGRRVDKVLVAPPLEAENGEGSGEGPAGGDGA